LAIGQQMRANGHHAITHPKALAQLRPALVTGRHHHRLLANAMATLCRFDQHHGLSTIDQSRQRHSDGLAMGLTDSHGCLGGSR
jgi:hypothetical protein